MYLGLDIEIEKIKNVSLLGLEPTPTAPEPRLLTTQPLCQLIPYIIQKDGFQHMLNDSSHAHHVTQHHPIHTLFKIIF